MPRRLFRLVVPESLRNKLFLILLINILVPISLIGTLSYFSFYVTQQNRIEQGMLDYLKDVRMSLDNTLDNLNYLSKQLALDASITKQIEVYLHPNETPFNRIQVRNDVYDKMTFLSYGNTTIGTAAYYTPQDHTYLFQNSLVKPELSPLEWPVLTQDRFSIYNGPHVSLHRYSEHLVFSVARKVEASANIPTTYVYIETSQRVFRDLLPTEQNGIPVHHVIVNDQDMILFSELPEQYAIGQTFALEPGKHKDDTRNVSLFVEASSNGFSLISIVDRGELSSVMTNWLARFVLICILSLLFSLLLAWLIWRLIYTKLIGFKKEIQLLGSYQFHSPRKPLGATEFDELLLKFYGMRDRIADLVVEVEEKERNKRMLEVEKLKYQINPHFIHNTLNTIQWIALMNRQDEIVRLVSIFTRILHYNLGKEGEIVQVKDEMNALQDYISLQKIRYNYNFDIAIVIDEDVLHLPIPRFLVQPLVENALYHGFKDKDGRIAIRGTLDGAEHFRIEVADNGQGMTPDRKQTLLERKEESGKTGFGIGLSFVNRMIQQYYGERYQLMIDSEVGQGTTMRLRLPTSIDRSGANHENIDRGR